MESNIIPVISFVGNSNSGKTTYLEKLIAEMKQRGYKIATIKHDVHGFEIDIPGKDTWRHAQAGADIVCISAPTKVAIIRTVPEEESLDSLLKNIRGVDIIFTEGYKKERKPKVEVYRQAVCDYPVARKEELLAIVSDIVIYDDVPHFGLEDVTPMADLLIKTIINGV